ncbi:MAG TPA: hypothetical protein RMH99_26835, partial [Sandaracinaceae bacterium LLY-WYZ-13_1]|nr:hypothetical protein [Sandaracinaceae bacterium LLY-WYZ-13_1]
MNDAPARWPLRRAPEALALAARHAGWASSEGPPPLEPAGAWPAARERALEIAAASAGVELEALQAAAGALERVLAAAGPALVEIPDDAPDGSPSYLALVRGG